MKGVCHCGAIVVTVGGPPDYMNQCNCTACTKLGALWGYYRPDEVAVAGAPVGYRRADVSPAMLRFEFCGTCGSTVAWRAADEKDGEDRMAVNMRLFEPEALDGVPVLYGDRRRFSGGSRQFYREPTRFGAAGTAA